MPCFLRTQKVIRSTFATTNSGYLRFQSFREFDKNSDGHKIDKEAIISEISNEMLSDEQLAEKVITFSAACKRAQPEDTLHTEKGENPWNSEVQ
jgi:hypothetical protein